MAGNAVVIYGNDRWVAVPVIAIFLSCADSMLAANRLTAIQKYADAMRWG